MRFAQFIEQSELNKYNQYVENLVEICSKKHITYKKINDLYCVIINPKAKNTILITATIHGNEPAGAMGCLKYLKEYTTNPNVRIVMFPLLNPYGFIHNKRNNEDDLDMNRQFGSDNTKSYTEIQKALTSYDYDLYLSIHEDSEAKGFYLYYSQDEGPLNPQSVIKVAKKHFSIVSNKMYSNDKMKDGAILVDAKNRNESRQHSHSLEEWIRKQCHIDFFCIETPSSQPMSKRANCVADIISYIDKRFLS